MSILERARADIKKITSNKNDFGVDITFVAPDASTATVAGLHTKHHEDYDAEGHKTVKKQAHILVSEALLIAAGYTVRNNDGEVYLKGHKVTVKDSTGENKTYKIREAYPDETLGVIKCYLGNSE